MIAVPRLGFFVDKRAVPTVKVQENTPVELL